MVKSLLENQTLFLEKYLHELIPAVITCIVARQLCTRPDVDNHWALRDFASRLMSNICKNFNTSTNNVQTRVTRMFCDSLESERTPLVSYYGALAGLQELGPEVIKVFILPNIKSIAARIEVANSEPGVAGTSASVEKVAAKHIQNLLIKSVVPVLKANPGLVADANFKAEFGYMGPYLLAGVQKVRGVQQQQQQQTASKNPGLTVNTQQQLLQQQQQQFVGTPSNKPTLINTATGPRYVMVSAPPGTPGTPGTPGK